MNLAVGVRHRFRFPIGSPQTPIPRPLFVAVTTSALRPSPLSQSIYDIFL